MTNFIFLHFLTTEHEGVWKKTILDKSWQFLYCWLWCGRTENGRHTRVPNDLHRIIYWDKTINIIDCDLDGGPAANSDIGVARILSGGALFLAKKLTTFF